jgi:hypothetical protein
VPDLGGCHPQVIVMDSLDWQGDAEWREMAATLAKQASWHAAGGRRRLSLRRCA